MRTLTKNIISLFLDNQYAIAQMFFFPMMALAFQLMYGIVGMVTVRTYNCVHYSTQSKNVLGLTKVDEARIGTFDNDAYLSSVLFG